MQKEEYLICYECSKEVDTNGDYMTYGSYGLMHMECHENHISKSKEWEREEQVRINSDRKNTERLIRKLKKSLKPKIWEWIEYELSSHYHNDLGIVKLEDFSCRNKTKHSEYIGSSTPLRHIYIDTLSDDSGYGGYIYIYIGKKRYLKAHIWG